MPNIERLSAQVAQASEVQHWLAETEMSEQNIAGRTERPQERGA